jgi:hypothetical protein
MDSEKPRKNPFNGAAIVPGNPGNSGGKKGRSGRRPSWVQAQSRDAYADTVKHLRCVAVNGYELFKQKGPDGKVIEMRRPATLDQRIKAAQVLGTFGGLNRLEVTGEDGGPVKTEEMTETERERASRIALLLSRVNGN